MEKEVLIIGISTSNLMDSDGYLCFDLSDRSDIEELKRLKNSESIIEYIVTPVGERFACLKRN